MAHFLPDDIVDRVRRYETGLPLILSSAGMYVVGVTEAPPQLILNCTVNGQSHRERQAISDGPISLGFYMSSCLGWFVCDVGGLIVADAPFGRLRHPETGDLAAVCRQLLNVQVLFFDRGLVTGLRSFAVTEPWRRGVAGALLRLPIYETEGELKLAVRREDISIERVWAQSRLRLHSKGSS